MLEELSRHGLEDVKERNGGILRLSQKRSHILDRARGTLGLIDGYENSHGVSSP